MEEQPATNLASAATSSEPAEAASLRDVKAPGPGVRTHYVVISVEEAPVPDGGQGTDWCRYVLSCGASRITGLHRGTVDEVTAFAESCVEGFNVRSATGKGKASVAYARKTAPVPPAR